MAKADELIGIVIAAGAGYLAYRFLSSNPEILGGGGGVRGDLGTSGSNLNLDDLLGGTGGGVTPKVTTPKVTTPKVTTPKGTTPNKNCAPLKEMCDAGTLPAEDCAVLMPQCGYAYTPPAAPPNRDISQLPPCRTKVDAEQVTDMWIRDEITEEQYFAYIDSCPASALR